MLSFFFFISQITFVIIICNSSPSIQTLWPLPASFTNGSNVIILCKSDDIKIISNLPSNPSNHIIGNATRRFINYIKNAPTSFIIRSMSRPPETPPIQNPPSNCISNININIATKNEILSLNTNVNYSLSVNISHGIIIESGTVYGGFVYGLITLSQLIRYSVKYSSNIISNSPWNIIDYPVFKYRGLMIDTGRNYLSISLIKKILIAMSFNKMNVLHWHMIDAQSFPFYSKSHPELSQHGSYGIDKMYRPSIIKEIVSFAKNLAIRVIPEWESPGHDTSMGFSHPGIMTCNQFISNKISARICYEPPCGYLNLANKTGKKLAIKIFNDLSKDSFDVFTDKVFHIGGDEVLKKCFGDKTIEIFNEWIEGRVKFLVEHNKIPAMWSGNKIMDSDYGQNKTDIIVFAWRNVGNDKLNALRAGYKIVDASKDYYYLDCGLGDWQNPMGNCSCNPYRTWGVIYNHSLYDGIPKNEINLYKNNIYGGEVCVWGETVDDGNFESRTWMRAAAAAERWWKNIPMTKENTNGILLRFQIQRYWMKHQGIMSTPLGPQYCLFNAEYCDLHTGRGTRWGQLSKTQQQQQQQQQQQENTNNETRQMSFDVAPFVVISCAMMFIVGSLFLKLKFGSHTKFC